MSQPKVKAPVLPQVFVSYSSNDVDQVLSVAEQLEKAGVSIWRDGDRILGGHYYGEQIVHALAHSKVVLVMCSPQAFRSDNVHREVLLTWDFYHRNYLPLWLTPRVDIPERFRYCLVGCQWIEVYEQAPEQWLPKVLAALESLGAGPSVPTVSNDVAGTPRAGPRSGGPRFQPGDRPVLGSDWELVRLLGKGGYGEVWLAHNPDLPGQQPVALKFCFDLDAKAKELLRHEADMVLRAQRSANVGGMVPLLHTYLNNDPPCLEYPYVEGGTLVTLIDDARQAGAPLTPDHVQSIVERIAEIVGSFHRAKPQLVHRDLKPSNVLIARQDDGRLVIQVTDFGIGGVVAKPMLDRSRSGYSLQENLSAILTGAYTPLYASPQQVQGGKADPRDDVYALGVIWHQLLTGDLTAPAPTGRMWMRFLKQRGMTEAAIELLTDCFEISPEHRPADGAVLAERLRELTGPETRSALPPETKPREPVSMPGPPASVPDVPNAAPPLVTPPMPEPSPVAPPLSAAASTAPSFNDVAQSPGTVKGGEVETVQPALRPSPSAAAATSDPPTPPPAQGRSSAPNEAAKPALSRQYVLCAAIVVQMIVAVVIVGYGQHPSGFEAHWALIMTALCLTGVITAWVAVRARSTWGLVFGLTPIVVAWTGWAMLDLYSTYRYGLVRGDARREAGAAVLDLYSGYRYGPLSQIVQIYPFALLPYLVAYVWREVRGRLRARPVSAHGQPDHHRRMAFMAIAQLACLVVSPIVQSHYAVVPPHYYGSYSSDEKPALNDRGEPYYGSYSSEPSLALAILLWFIVDGVGAGLAWIGWRGRNWACMLVGISSTAASLMILVVRWIDAPIIARSGLDNPFILSMVYLVVVLPALLHLILSHFDLQRVLGELRSRTAEFNRPPVDPSSPQPNAAQASSLLYALLAIQSLVNWCVPILALLAALQILYFSPQEAVPISFLIGTVLVFAGGASSIIGLRDGSKWGGSLGLSVVLMCLSGGLISLLGRENVHTGDSVVPPILMAFFYAFASLPYLAWFIWRERRPLIAPKHAELQSSSRLPQLAILAAVQLAAILCWLVLRWRLAETGEYAERQIYHRSLAASEIMAWIVADLAGGVSAYIAWNAGLRRWAILGLSGAVCSLLFLLLPSMFAMVGWTYDHQLQMIFGVAYYALALPALVRLIAAGADPALAVILARSAVETSAIPSTLQTTAATAASAPKLLYTWLAVQTLITWGWWILGILGGMSAIADLTFCIFIWLGLAASGTASSVVALRQGSKWGATLGLSAVLICLSGGVLALGSGRFYESFQSGSLSDWADCMAPLRFTIYTYSLASLPYLACFIWRERRPLAAPRRMELESSSQLPRITVLATIQLAAILCWLVLLWRFYDSLVIGKIIIWIVGDLAAAALAWTAWSAGLRRWSLLGIGGLVYSLLYGFLPPSFYGGDLMWFGLTYYSLMLPAFVHLIVAGVQAVRRKRQPPTI